MAAYWVVLFMQHLLSTLLCALRSLIFFPIYFGFIIIWLSLTLTFPLFMPRKMRYRLVKSVFGYGIALIARVVCGIRYNIVGLEHLPSDGRGHVFLSKHQSNWETFFFQYLIHPQTQVAKKELARIPIFGWAFSLMDPIYINRDEPADAMQQIIDKGSKQLAKGTHILLYPEGTRTAPGMRRPFRKGGIVLAKATNAPVIAIAHNAGECWPKKGLLIKPGLITVVISPVIETTELSQDELLHNVESWINNTVEEISATPFSGKVINEVS